MGVPFFCPEHTDGIRRDAAYAPGLFESLLGSSLAKAERCCNITFRDAPFFGSFLADEQDQKLSVLKPAVSQCPGLNDRRSPQHGGCRYGRPHHLRQKRRGCGPSLKNPVVMRLPAFPRRPYESF